MCVIVDVPLYRKPRHLGPYQVVRQTQNGSYVVKELNGDVSRESIAAFRLLAYHPSHDNLENLAADPIDAVGAPRQQITEPIDEENEEPDWESFEEDAPGYPSEYDSEDDDEPIGYRTRSQQTQNSRV
ncbi:hypothetical protein BV20DRAFT_957070 [Pilatotrama ljubarskyi]|nr:hypothetical protein BV20DRAFT_957070 [Pilatotrama ljubarskyi]